MAVTMTLIRTAARQFAAPDEIARHVNTALSTNNPRGMYATLFCCVIDTAKMTLCCVNAGHPSPVLLRPGEAPSLPFDSTSSPIGMFDTLRVEVQWLDLRPEDGVVMYSDGVGEAFDAAGESVELDDPIARLARAAGRSAAGMTSGLREPVRRHVGSHPQSDDIAILALACHLK
jgi:sigma-B regulation protein RsbU (phosphoserine phosphatase)